MMMIIVSKIHFSEIEFQSTEAYPYECCGAMLGTVLDDGAKEVLTCIPIHNQSTEDKRRRFKITDDDYRLLESKADELKMTLLGFYHSHPDHPAFPSETDLQYAWPFFSYIIQSVYNGQSRDFKSFELSLDTHTFVDEQLVIK